MHVKCMCMYIVFPRVPRVGARRPRHLATRVWCRTSMPRACARDAARHKPSGPRGARAFPPMLACLIRYPIRIHIGHSPSTVNLPFSSLSNSFFFRTRTRTKCEPLIGMRRGGNFDRVSDLNYPVSTTRSPDKQALPGSCLPCRVKNLRHFEH